MHASVDLLAEIRPSPIASLLVREMYADIIAAVPLFRGLPDEIVTKLCMSLTPLPTLAGHDVYEQNALADEMYILIDGSLQVTKRMTGAHAPNYIPRVHFRLVRYGPARQWACCNAFASAFASAPSLREKRAQHSIFPNTA
eukprot:SAG11_NODE_627_length_8087_cov_3.567852_10_plen_141_part_00